MNILELDPSKLVFPKLEFGEDSAGHSSAKPHFNGERTFFLPPMVCRWGVGDLNPAKKISKHSVSMARDETYSEIINKKKVDIVKPEQVQKTFDILNRVDESLAKHILSSEETKLEYFNDKTTNERDVRKALNPTLKWSKKEEDRAKYGPAFRPVVPFVREKDAAGKDVVTSDLKCTVVDMRDKPIINESTGKPMTARDLIGRGYVGSHTVQISTNYSNNYKAVGTTWTVQAIRIIRFLSHQAPLPPVDMFGDIPYQNPNPTPEQQEERDDAFLCAEADRIEAELSAKNNVDDDDFVHLPPVDDEDTNDKKRPREEEEEEEEAPKPKNGGKKKKVVEEEDDEEEEEEEEKPKPKKGGNKKKGGK